MVIQMKDADRENLGVGVFVVMDEGKKIKKESGGNQSADLELNK